MYIYTYIYIYIYIYILHWSNNETYGISVRVNIDLTPGPHDKNPRHKMFAKGWVAQNNGFDRYLDWCAKIFQDVPRVGSEQNRIF